VEGTGFKKEITNYEFLIINAVISNQMTVGSLQFSAERTLRKKEKMRSFLPSP